MPTITFVEHSGKQHSIDAPAGISVMRAAVDNAVPGILADCGGFLSCATCHGYIDENWLAGLPPPSDEECVMVDCAIDVRPNSRLTCQIMITESLDGLVVHVPETQS